MKSKYYLIVLLLMSVFLMAGCSKSVNKVLPIEDKNVREASLPVASAAVNASSLMFRGNAQHTGVFNSKAIKSVGKELWKMNIQDPLLENSTPVISEGVLFFASKLNFNAIDARTGQTKWKLGIFAQCREKVK